MTFTHLVLIKKSPFYIYCANEQDAISTLNMYQNDMVGVVVAKEGLEVKVPVMKVRLHSVEQQQIEYTPEQKVPFFDEENSREEISKMVDDLTDEAVEDAIDVSPKP